MRRLIIGLLGAVVAASRLTAATNLVAGATNSPSLTVPAADDPVEKEYKKLMESDDAVQAEVDDWIKDNEAAAAKGAGVPAAGRAGTGAGATSQRRSRRRCRSRRG